MKRDDHDDYVNASTLANPLGPTQLTIRLGDGQTQQYEVQGGLIFAALSSVPSGASTGVHIDAGIIGTAACSAQLVGHLMAALHRNFGGDLGSLLVEIGMAAAAIERDEQRGIAEHITVLAEDVTSGRRVAIVEDEDAAALPMDMRRCN